jgi:hypothetical protein
MLVSPIALVAVKKGTQTDSTSIDQDFLPELDPGPGDTRADIKLGDLVVVKRYTFLS